MILVKLVIGESVAPRWPPLDQWYRPRYHLYVANAAKILSRDAQQSPRLED